MGDIAGAFIDMRPQGGTISAGTGCAIFWGAFFRADNRFWGIIFAESQVVINFGVSF